MKHPEDAWEHQPPFDEDRPEDSPNMIAVRRIELISRLHRMAFRSILREDGLPPAQAGAIRDIIREPGLSQRELADRLHIQRATATVMLQKMDVHHKKNAFAHQTHAQQMITHHHLIQIVVIVVVMMMVVVVIKLKVATITSLKDIHQENLQVESLLQLFYQQELQLQL